MECKLSEIYKGLITETISRNELIKAMDDKRLITIYYDSPHGTINKGWRRIEPLCYGINHSDNSVLRAWQIHGVSDTPNGRPSDPLTEIPGYRMFRIDGIKNIMYTGKDTFTQPRPKYNPADSDMKIIYKAVKFDSSSTPTPEVEPEDEPLFPTTASPAPDAQVPLPPPSVTPSVTPSKPNKPLPASAKLTQPDAGDKEDDKLKDKPEWLKVFLDKFKKLVNYNL